MTSKSRSRTKSDNPESVARKWIAQDKDPPGFEKVFIQEKIGK